MRPLSGLLLCAAFVAAPAVAQQPPTATPATVTRGAGSSYHLSPGDLLMVKVFGHDEYSGQFQVDETGKLTFPVIGEIDTRNATVADVRERLKQGLGTLFNQPFVIVTPLFRIAVLGEILRPGLYTVDPTLSVIDVIALAGGATQSGNLNDIRLLRGGHEQKVSLEQQTTVNGSLEAIGIRSGDQIIVPSHTFTAATMGLLLQVLGLGISIILLYNSVK